MNILLAEDYEHTRKTIVYALKTMIPNVSVLEAENGLAALNAVKSGFKPDVVLMDISMPIMNGIDSAREIKKILSDTKIIMLTSFSNKEQVMASFYSGANAYCLKNIKTDRLVSVINSVVQGAMWIDPSIAQYILDMFKYAEKTAFSTEEKYDFDLTAREKEILRLVSLGKSNKDIANELVLSIYTVKNHLKNILQKLCVEDRTQAAIMAIKENLV